MRHNIIDTNVPLTAAGFNSEASADCALICEEVINGVIRGEIAVVIDREESAIAEYRQNIYPDPKGTRAGQFLMFLLMNRHRPSRVRSIELERDANGLYMDYPDRHDLWTSDDERCESFDANDKKWVALAVAFRRETGDDAPIVNAADRCWLAFNSHLESAGVKLEILCRHERERYRIE